VSYRRLMLLALALGIPRVGSAQFTTFIPPRSQATTDSAKAVVAARQKAPADTSVNARLTNMKTWVDSAAGVASPPATAADSLAAQSNPSNPQPSNPQPAAADTAMRASGTRAPATASELPLIAVSGAGLLLIGTILVGGARPARQRA
jgi:hypothetical protein